MASKVPLIKIFTLQSSLLHEKLSLRMQSIQGVVVVLKQCQTS